MRQATCGADTPAGIVRNVSHETRASRHTHAYMDDVTWPVGGHPGGGCAHPRRPLDHGYCGLRCLRKTRFESFPKGLGKSDLIWTVALIVTAGIGSFSKCLQ